MKDMEWGEPCEHAALHAMRLVYSYPAYYSDLARGAIRERFLELLSPQTTGSDMKSRLQLLQDCLTIVHDNNDPVNSKVCLSKVLGVRKR